MPIVSQAQARWAYANQDKKTKEAFDLVSVGAGLKVYNQAVARGLFRYATIAGWGSSSDGKGGNLVILCPDNNVAKVLKTAGMDALIPIHQTETAATAALAS